MQNDASSADDRITADSDPSSDGYRGAQPHIVFYRDRVRAFPSLSAAVVVIDGMQSGHQLCARSDPAVIPDTDDRVVHKERVGIDEDIVSEPSVVSVAALKPRDNYGASTYFAEKPRQRLGTCIVIVGGCGVEYIELSPAISTLLAQFVVVEIPLTTREPTQFFPHAPIIAQRPSAGVMKIGGYCLMSDIGTGAYLSIRQRRQGFGIRTDADEFFLPAESQPQDHHH